MSAGRETTFTLGEYFALERASERRFEYRDGRVVRISGGTRRHGRIARYAPAGPPHRYPAASVVCGEERFRRVGALGALENPVLVVEVLSPSSADYDRGTKFEEYRSIPSFRECLLVDQSRLLAAHRTMLDDGGWTERLYRSADDAVPVPSLGIDLPVAGLYEGVDWE